MRKRQQRRPLMTEINITPFTDVLLVLLIIFMVATPLIYKGQFDLKLPEANAAPEQRNNAAFTIEIDAAGTVAAGGSVYALPGDRANLESKLRELSAGAPDAAVTVNGDRAARYEDVFRVVDLLAELGLKKVALGANLSLPER